MAYETIPPSPGGTADIDIVSTGLTLSSGTLTANLSVGVSGGQTATGGTGAGDNLTLSTTSNGTKGKVIFGTVNAFNWVNEGYSGNNPQFSIGDASATLNGAIAGFTRSNNGGSYLHTSNTSTGTAARGGIIVNQSASAFGNNYIGFFLQSTGYTTAGELVANSGLFELNTNTSAPFLISNFGGGAIKFLTTGSQTLRAQITNAGSFVMGSAALATTATDGFLYIAGGAGTPTGVPTAAAGRYPLYWDTTNKKLYIYDGAWLGGTTPGAFT